MDLDLTEDQLALREMVEGFTTKESPIAVVRDAEPLGFDPRLWHHVVAMGLPSMAVPEAAGGGGAGILDLAVAVEQLGRALSPVPVIEAAVATLTLAESAGDTPGATAALAEAAVAGELMVTLAVQPAADGVARLVPAGAVADAVLALDGDELVVTRQHDISPEHPAPAVPNLGSLPLADRSLHTGERIVVARGTAAVDAHHRAVQRWQLLTAVAQVGAGDRALELGLEYVMERRAFGVLIGSFQAIQHRLADDVTALEGARLLAYEAAWAHDAGAADAARLAAMAFLFASETAFTTAAHCLQFHGGYGYTLEYDIQLYFRRSKAWTLLAGDPRAGYADLAHRLYPSKEEG
jgi:alkylation response protein AidB-like acyl-CoA dehydrogenase